MPIIIDVGNDTGGNSGSSGSGSNNGGGFLSGILESLFGAGWNFSCLGSQAYKKADLNRDLQKSKNEYAAVDWNDLVSIQSAMNMWSWEAGRSAKAIQNYQSSCSKQLRQKFLDFQNGLIADVKTKITFTYIMNTVMDTIEGQFTYPYYTVTGFKTPTVGTGTGTGTGVGTGTGTGTGVGTGTGTGTGVGTGINVGVGNIPTNGGSILDILVGGLGNSNTNSGSSNVPEPYFTGDGIDLSGSLGGWNFGLNNNKDNTMYYLLGGAVFILAFAFINKKK